MIRKILKAKPIYQLESTHVSKREPWLKNQLYSFMVSKAISNAKLLRKIHSSSYASQNLHIRMPSIGKERSKMINCVLVIIAILIFFGRLKQLFPLAWNLISDLTKKIWAMGSFNCFWSLAWARNKRLISLLFGFIFGRMNLHG